MKELALWFILIIVNLSCRYTQQKNLNTFCGRSGDVFYQGKCIPFDHTLFRDSISREVVYCKCGQYSRSSGSDRSRCACLNGYLRSAKQVMNYTAPCYKIEVTNLRVEQISRDSIRVSWQVPAVLLGQISITVACRGGAPSHQYHYRTRQKVSFEEAVTFANITNHTKYTINVQPNIRHLKMTLNSSIIFFLLNNQNDSAIELSTSTESRSSSFEYQLERHRYAMVRLFLTSFIPPVCALVLLLFMTSRLYKSRVGRSRDVTRKYQIVKEHQQNGRRDNDESFFKQIASNFYS